MAVLSRQASALATCACVVTRASSRALVLLALALPACTEVAPFSVAQIDRSLHGESAFPIAVETARVGTYPGSAKAGGGYFYDDVLEYRVWMHPEKGARRRAGDEDYFAAFAQYEAARDFSTRTAGAEPPLALVRQLEWIDEPTPDHFSWERAERITEWQVRWLADSHREPLSIPDFLARRGVK